MAISLSLLAVKDLDAIREYTVNQWGRKQWLKYYRGLVASFELIEVSPEKGRSRELLYSGMRSVNYKEHIIFYKRIKANNNNPVILRVCHQKRNLPALIYYEGLFSGNDSFNA